MTTTIEIRGGTKAAWTSANPVLASREPGLETDTRRWKWGDGTTAWNALPYIDAEPSVYITTTSYTLAAGVGNVFMDGGASTLTLPPVSSFFVGKRVTIRTGATTTCTVSTTSPDQFYPTITSIGLGPNESLILYCDGTNWVVAGRSFGVNDTSAWTAYTPTFNSTWTAATKQGRYKLVGKTLSLRVFLSNITTGSGNLQVSLPAGMSYINDGVGSDTLVPMKFQDGGGGSYWSGFGLVSAGSNVMQPSAMNAGSNRTDGIVAGSFITASAATITLAGELEIA